jgi:hypothetical protein
MSIPQTVPGVNRLLDTIVTLKRLKNDAALSRLLETSPPSVSKLRSGARVLGAAVLLRMHDVSDLPIADMKAMLAGTESAPQQ